MFGIEAGLRRALSGTAQTGPFDPSAVAQRSARLAMYVHVPFCSALCTYCTFNKTLARGEPGRLLMEDYVRGLSAELDLYAAVPAITGMEVSSLFFGGGTPTLLPEGAVAALLDRVRTRFRVRPGAQVTLEANPESVAPEKLAAYRAAGIDRLSLGVQAFEPEVLRLLGRRHRERDVALAIEASCKAGFREISIDLMYGLPGQSEAAFLANLERAAALPITHLSIFPMVFREGAPLVRQRPAAWIARLGRLYGLLGTYRRSRDLLSALGFSQYTPEDFTRSGVRCAYQVDVWSPPVAGCVALGAGTLSGLETHQWTNLADPSRYAQVAQQGTFPVARWSRRGKREAVIDGFIRSTKVLPADDDRRGAGEVERRRWRSPATVTFLSSLLWSTFILDELARAAAANP